MKIFSCFVAAAAMLFCAGCAFSEFKTTAEAAKDSRVTMVESKGFSLKLLRTVTKIDDDGCLNADVTFELSGAPFFTWTSCGTPMQYLLYRFDWVDAKGKVLKGTVKRVQILPGTILTVGGIAPSEKYKNFKFEINFCDKPCKGKAPVCCEKKTAPVKKAAAKPVAVKKAPAKKAVSKPAPAKATPAKAVPAKKAAAKPVAVKKAPAKKAASKPAPAKATPAKAVPAKKAAAKPAPAKATPAKAVPVKKAAAKPAPAKATPAKAAPAKAEVKKTPAAKVPAATAASAVKANGKLAESLQ